MIKKEYIKFFNYKVFQYWENDIPLSFKYRFSYFFSVFFVLILSDLIIWKQKIILHNNILCQIVNGIEVYTIVREQINNSQHFWKQEVIWVCERVSNFNTVFSVLHFLNLF